jgi:hypothetical protein
MAQNTAADMYRIAALTRCSGKTYRNGLHVFFFY